jgi:hypothetical protein
MIFAVALVAVALAAQPVKAPKEKGVAESEHTHSAGKSQNANTPQEPSQANNSPTAPASISTASQPAAKATESDTHAGAENINTQWWIEIFTGVLACVGVLQLAVMFLTWMVYRRQAREMRRQRHEMRRQRHVMHGQWKAMREQLSEMAAQTEVLKQSVDHAGTSAEVALRSVKLQEALLQQWVHVGDWTFHNPLNIYGAAQVKITFNIANPTRMPLTLRNIANTTSIVWVLPKQFGTIGLHYLLAPENVYPVEIFFALAGENLIRFQSKQTITLAISFTVTFEDAWGAMKEQTFGYTCDCNSTGWAEFRVFEGRMANKDTTPEEDKKNPN